LRSSESNPSSFDSDDDALVFIGNHFEISKFQSSEIAEESSKLSSVHNFEISQFLPMESDCKDHSSAKLVSSGNALSSTTMVSSGNSEMLQMLAAISSQMTSNYQALQEQMVQNDSRLSTDFQRVVHDNDSFKQEVRAEIDSLWHLLTSPHVSSSSSSSNVLSSVPDSPPISSSSLPSTTTVNSTSGFSSSSPQDFQAQMMMMLNDTFSKLSTVIVDSKSVDTKSDWPKFSGDSKKFKAWYLAILAQLSLPPWQDLYDSISNDIVLTTSNTTLNGKLYAKLLVSLEGQALQSIVSRKHLRANGLLLLHELTQTYKPKTVPEVIAAKTGEFRSKTKRLSSETVDMYYTRFHDLLDELSEADEQISAKSAMRHFIFTLGPEFEAIQHNFRIGNLPTEWHTQDWPTLLVLCRDYYIRK
jgi:hypothetical protein